MKILFVCDEEDKYLYDYYQPGRLDDVDLIISCGDLRPEYLSFLVTVGHAPLLYVRGNHDTQYETRPPEGCICIEDQILNVNGLRILGLGGSILYNGGPNQYTERQMRKRIRKLRLKLWWHKGVDLVVTHAPIRGLGDGDDLCHRGFEAFKPLLEKYKPRYLAHGHVHLSYGHDKTRVRQCGETTVINTFGKYLLDLPDYPLEHYIIL